MKTIAINFLLFFCSIGVFAQVAIGIQGGANLSQMDFTNNVEYRFTEVKATSGFIGGLVVQFIGEKHAGVQFELNYSQRGWIETDTTMQKDIEYDTKMDYIDLPILTHVNIGGGNFRGLLNLGPYLGYGLNRKTIVTDHIEGTEETFDYTFDSDIDNRIDFGLLVGAGFEYRIGSSKLSVEGRYTVGLGDVNKVKANQSEVSQFRVISIMARYTMPLNRSKEE